MKNEHFSFFHNELFRSNIGKTEKTKKQAQNEYQTLSKNLQMKIHFKYQKLMHWNAVS